MQSGLISLQITEQPQGDLKRCTHCGSEKPLTAFNRHSRAKDRRQPWCRECSRAESERFHRLGPREKGREKEKLYERYPIAYYTWISMKQRCFNPNVKDYKNYGGRGITVCERWRNSFAAFLADMGDKPPKLTIERINNDGNYEPSNCRWATRKEQVQNQRNTSQRERERRKAALNIARLNLWPRLVAALTEFERIHYVMTDDHENEEESLLQKDVTPLLREIAALERDK